MCTYCVEDDTGIIGPGSGTTGSNCGTMGEDDKGTDALDALDTADEAVRRVMGSTCAGAT